MVKWLIRHEVFSHFYRCEPNRSVAYQSIGGASDAENRRKMACRGIEDSVGKQQRTGGLRARVNDVAVKTLSVNHTAVCNSDDERSAFSILRIELHACSAQGVQTRRCGKSRNHTGSAETRMRQTS